MRRAAPAGTLFRLAVLAPLVVAVTGSGGSPRHEIEAVRDQILEDFGYPPVYVNDSTTIVRVERHWHDQIRVHLDNGHTFRVAVELDTY